jgi:hypothetical protein
MDPIQAVIEDIKSREPGASFLYRAMSKKKSMVTVAPPCSASTRVKRAIMQGQLNNARIFGLRDLH